eukprot:3616861-Pyramimonas_sp.AAC.1
MRPQAGSEWALYRDAGQNQAKVACGEACQRCYKAVVAVAPGQAFRSVVDAAQTDQPLEDRLSQASVTLSSGKQNFQAADVVENTRIRLVLKRPVVVTSAATVRSDLHVERIPKRISDTTAVVTMPMESGKGDETLYLFQPEGGGDAPRTAEIQVIREWSMNGKVLAADNQLFAAQGEEALARCAAVGMENSGIHTLLSKLGNGTLPTYDSFLESSSAAAKPQPSPAATSPQRPRMIGAAAFSPQSCGRRR